MNVNVDEVDAIFCAAIELPTPEERADYLANVCGDNADLRRRVDKLLAAHFAAGSFLDPRSTVLQLSPHLAMPYGPGSTIGPYKLIEQVGEGGMGVVFKAEQPRPVQRTVALKIIKPGMDTRQVIARFEAERQALAVMDHPNIARVFDAGTTEMGLPYFVMELVHGVPITRYCDEHRFAPSRRLELFIAVCQAVQHAHQKGIIHRDLKPSNVLVSEYDGRPVVKIIDFGVAKAVGESLTDKTLLTEVGQVLGTIEYMSPEQAKLNQVDIDTRTDIYSLGVLLYELLTGTTPFDARQLRSAAFDEMLRTIREVEPPKPSTRLSSSDALPSIAANRGLEPGKLTGLVRGDLDWIALKALDKDRDRRYETANGLAIDVERYLGNEPVAACPPSRAYRFRKFARRNRTALTTAAVIALALLAGTVGTAWQSILATRQRDRALAAEGLAQTRAEEAKGQAQIARDQELLTRKNLYNLQMNAAWDAWNADNVGHVLELLNGLRPELGRGDVRRFGWHYLWRLCHSERLTLHGQNKSCGRVAFSPQGDLIATCGDQDTFIELWDAATGDKRATLNEHNDGLNVVAFSPDGTLLASGSEDGILKIWNVATGQVNLSLKAHTDQVFDLAFSPDGKTLASSSVMVYLRDVKTGKLFSELRGNTGYVYRIAFSPDGQMLAAGSADVILWNVVAGTKIATLTGHTSGVGPVVFSPDGKTLASAGDDDSIKLWDVQGLREKATLRGHNGDIEGLAFSPDGKTLASASVDETAKLWDLASQFQLASFKGHTDAVWSVAFSPDGRTVATASHDATVKLWDVGDLPRSIVLQGHTDRVYDVAFSPAGTTLASASRDGSVKLWSVPAGQEQKTLIRHAGGAETATFSPDGKTMATSGRDFTVRLWDVATGRERSTFDRDGNSVKRVRFTPNGKILGWAEKDRTVLWDLAEGQERFVLGDTRRRRDDVSGEGLSVSPDGALVVTRGAYDLFKLWDVATGQELAALDASAPVTDVAFAPDGKSFAAASLDGRIQIWHSATRRLMQSFVAHASGVRSFAYSPDQHLLATGGVDGIVKLWDLTTGQVEAVLKSHIAAVYAIAFSPDGNILASGSLDHTVRLWDLTIDPQATQELHHARARKAILSSPEANSPNPHP